MKYKPIKIYDVNEKYKDSQSPGYAFIDDLYKKINQNKNHSLSLQDALSFIKFYGFDDSNHFGAIRHKAILRIEKALMNENYTMVKISKNSKEDD